LVGSASIAALSAGVRSGGKDSQRPAQSRAAAPMERFLVN
jgi:hypothetical protein